MKKCSKCLAQKSPTDFHKGKSQCKACRAGHSTAWEHQHPEKVRAYKRDWSERNREKRRDIQRRSEYNRRARKQSNGVYLVTASDLDALLRQSCAASRLSQCSGDKQVDHIVPIARGGHHSIGNLQVLCAHHNASKRDRLWVEYRAAAAS